MKAKILKIGTVVDGRPLNWDLDCAGGVPGIQEFSDGSILYGGYSVEELQEIASRPHEWMSESV